MDSYSLSQGTLATQENRRPKILIQGTSIYTRRGCPSLQIKDVT